MIRGDQVRRKGLAHKNSVTGSLIQSQVVKLSNVLESFIRVSVIQIFQIIFKKKLKR